MVLADRLGKTFGHFRAVEGVSLSIPQGAIYGVLGPNGAGKTTTLRMLMGIIDPDQGSVRLLGSHRPFDVSSRVGYLPEERGLYPGMTARDAIGFMGALRGLSLNEGRTRADIRLAEVGLGHASKQKVRKWSSWSAR